ncbi:hypothetical protein ASF54_00440 [Frondihabitans sp. Leaf304]|nr:hypothetical protein ASF54_00440 [Frondihabitans sp. Leaf304]
MVIAVVLDTNALSAVDDVGPADESTVRVVDITVEQRRPEAGAPESESKPGLPPRLGADPREIEGPSNATDSTLSP